MTEPDEETKEHPIYPEPASVAPQPPAAFPGDPLQPTTTIGAIPAAPPTTYPNGPSYPAAPPAYPQSPAAYVPPAAYPPPGNAGWPGQTYPAAQPGQWQQPGYGVPTGYGQPTYAAVATYRTSFLVALAALVLIVFGAALTVLGAWTLTLGNDLSHFIRDNDVAIFGRQIDRDSLRTFVQPLPGVLIVFGVIQLLIGAVIAAHRSWARWLGVLLALLGLIASVVALSATLALVPGFEVKTLVPTVAVAGYAFVLLALIAGGGHFRKEVRRPR